MWHDSKANYSLDKFFRIEEVNREPLALLRFYEATKDLPTATKTNLVDLEMELKVLTNYEQKIQNLPAPANLRH
jgi:hypothetical protein